MKPKIPDYLESTVNLLRSAFGEQIDSKFAEPIAILISPHMSDRNFFKIFRYFFNHSEFVIENQLSKMISKENEIHVTESEVFKDTYQRLLYAGYLDWLREPD